MATKFYLQLLILVTISMATIPFRGTIQSPTGTPISGAKVVALSNKTSTLSNSVGQFGNGGTSIITSDVGNISINKPILQKDAFYFNAVAGQNYSYRLIDTRGRAIVEYSGTAEADGIQRLALSNHTLADGFYINILKVGNMNEIFKSVIAGNRTIRPQLLSDNAINNSRVGSNSFSEVELIDTLYFSAKGFKNKKVPVSDTGNIGIITLETADSGPEIACTKMFMGYTPENYPKTSQFGAARGDTVIIGMNLANWGASNALSVKCSLSTVDPKITMVKSVAGFNNIIQGDTMPQLNFFKVIIPRKLPEGYQVSFKLHITDSWGGAWEDAFIYMPYPFVISAQFVDSDGVGFSKGGKDLTTVYQDITEYTPSIKNLLGVDVENLKARLFPGNGGYQTRVLGNLHTMSEKRSPLDYNVQVSNGDTFEEKDILISVDGSDEYYLVPVDFTNTSLPRPATPNSHISVSYIGIEYTEGYYPLQRRNTVLLRTELKNSGTEAAYSVSCSLSTVDSRIEIITADVIYDNIPADTVHPPLFYHSLDSLNYWHYDSLYNPVHKVRIPRDFPAGETIPFVCHIRDSWGKSWVDTVHYMPYPFKISQDMVDDDQTPDSDGNGDGIVNNGEVIEYTPQLQNVSGKTVTNVVALFTESASYDVRDSDDKWSYGNFTPDQKQLPELDYVFTVHSEEALVNGIYQNDLLITATIDGQEKNFLVPVDLKSDKYGKPTVTVTGDKTSVLPGISVTFTATGNDFDGTVVKYIWAKNGVDFVDTTTSGVFQVQWDNPGPQTIGVKAIDNEENESTIASFSVMVNEAENLFKKNGMAYESVLLSNDNVVTVMECQIGEKKQIGIMESLPDNSSKWSHIYEYPNGSIATGIQKVDDGYIVVGTKFGTNNDILLLRLDNYGDTLWTKTLGGADYDYATAIEVVSDGFIIAGGSRSYSNSLDMLFIKTDRQGTVTWTKNHGTTNDDFAEDLRQTDDGKIIATGYYNAFDKDFPNIGIIKVKELAIVQLSQSGDLEWSKTYSGGVIENGNSIEIAKNGDYIIGGYTNSVGHWSGQGWVLRCNSSGDTLWTRFIGDEVYSQHCRSIIEMEDGTLVGTGFDYEFDPNAIKTILFKLSSTGTTLSYNEYGTSESFGVNVIKSSDNNLIVSGQDNYKPNVFRFTSNGRN